MRRLLFVASSFAIALPASAAVPIDGKWLTGGGKSIVEIGPCGAMLCGRVYRLLAEIKGAPTDRNNPDPALRARPLLGLNILLGFRDAGKQWEGKIYDPERGKTFRSVVFRNADGTLAVKGCISFLCQTQTWKPLR